MQFDIITIFPGIFNGFLKESLIARAQKKGLIKIRIHNLRKWAKDRHQTVDDRPFGGGLGMVLKIEPIYKAIKELNSLKGRRKARGKTKIIYLRLEERNSTKKLLINFQN